MNPSRRSDLDIAALVLSLKWPANSMNQAFAGGGRVLDALQRTAAQHTSPSGRAQRRWRMIRTLCIEYRRAHRCGILSVIHAQGYCRTCAVICSPMESEVYSDA